MKFVILKLICIVTLLSIGVLFIGCSNKGNSQNSSSESQETIVQDSTSAALTTNQTPYEIPHDTELLNVQSENIGDLLTLKHTMRNFIYLEEKNADKSEPGNRYFDTLEVAADKQSLNIPTSGVVSSMKCLRDKVIVEIYPENREGVVQLGVFDPYTNSYETIDDILFNAGYGNYSFTMNDRYYIMISSVNGEESLKGNVTIYDIETDTIETVDEFNEYNIVNGITPVGKNAIAYFYYEDITQDWVVNFYSLDTKESKEIFRHTNNNKDETASMMAIGTDGDEIVLVTQYIENEVYCTYLEWITSSGEWKKTEKINLNKLFGNEYEINNITVDGDYYFVDAYIIPRNLSVSSILKCSGDNLNIFSLNTLLPKDLLSSSFADKTNIIYDNYSFNYDNGISEHDKIDGIVIVDLFENSMRSFEFSEKPSLEDKVLVNSQGDLLIFYHDNNKMAEYQLIEDFRSIDTKPIDGGIPIFPSESDLTNDTFFKDKEFYYDNIY